MGLWSPATDASQAREAESAMPTALPTPASLSKGHLEDDTVCCSVLGCLCWVIRADRVCAELLGNCPHT